MPQQPIDFASLFPSAGTASFRFTEQIEGHFDVTITYKSRDAGGKRHIDLSVAGLPDSVNPGLFDRIVLAGNNMELHRALLRRKTVDISLPFVISPDPAVEDNIAVLFPVGGVGAGFDNGPFRGIARKSGGGNRLELKLVSKGPRRTRSCMRGR